MKHATGEEKIKYLEQQNILYADQLKFQKELEDKLNKQKSYYEYFLKNKGFVFTSDGNLGNYEEKLIAMEKELKTLNDIAEAKQKAQSNYNGKDDRFKDKLSAELDKARENADKYKDSLDEVKDYLNAYIDVSNNKLPGVKEDFLDINNAIQDNIDSIKEFQNEIKDLSVDSGYKDHERDLAEVNNALDKNEILLDKAQGAEKVKLLKERVELLEKLKKGTQDLINFEKSHRQDLMGDLSKYGMQFRPDGSIAGYGAVIENLKKTLSDEEFEEVFAKIEEYLNLTNEKIPGLENDYLELGNTIKDVYEEQLKITAEIEDKLTQMYKKQLEDRKKLIDEELKKRQDALDKQKKAYNDARKEADYKTDLDDQQKVISDLQNQIDMASKDISLSGQKRLQDLLKQLAIEEKKLQGIVQDKIDSDVNDMFDNESDRLEDQAEDAKDKLDKEFSDSKIAEMVAAALGSGVFTDIEGNVSSLEDALINFAKESGDLFGVLGSTIESELITKLKVSLDTVKELDKIFKELDIGSLKKQEFALDYNTRSFDGGAYSTSNSNTVQFNSPIMVVQGGIDRDVLPEVRDMMNKVKQDIIDGFYKHLK